MALVSYLQSNKEIRLPVCVAGVGVGYPQAAVTRPAMASHQLMITVGGCGVVRVDDRNYDVPVGCGFYISSEKNFSFSPKDRTSKSKKNDDESKWLVDWVSFDIGSDLLKKALFTDNDFFFFSFRDPATVSAKIRKISGIVENDTSYGVFSSSAAMYDLLIYVNRESLMIPQNPEKSNHIIDSVTAFIDDNYTDEINLSDLCDAAGGISEQYLCRLFKQYTGERPIEYILHKRISMARSYLEKTDMAITDVAKLTGFNNTSYFYRNFKKFTGVSPLNCRQNAYKKSANDS